MTGSTLSGVLLCLVSLTSGCALEAPVDAEHVDELPPLDGPSDDWGVSMVLTAETPSDGFTVSADGYSDIALEFETSYAGVDADGGAVSIWVRESLNGHTGSWIHKEPAFSGRRSLVFDRMPRGVYFVDVLRETVNDAPVTVRRGGGRGHRLRTGGNVQASGGGRRMSARDGFLSFVCREPNGCDATVYLSTDEVTTDGAWAPVTPSTERVLLGFAQKTPIDGIDIPLTLVPMGLGGPSRSNPLVGHRLTNLPFETEYWLNVTTNDSTVRFTTGIEWTPAGASTEDRITELLQAEARRARCDVSTRDPSLSVLLSEALAQSSLSRAPGSDIEDYAMPIAGLEYAEVLGAEGLTTDLAARLVEGPLGERLGRCSPFGVATMLDDQGTTWIAVGTNDPT